MTDHEYILPEPLKEVQRLTDQDSVFAYAMNNKRVFAPIDVTKPGLQVLDSATADGLFLRSIERQLTPPFTLSGFDIMRDFFPKSHPEHTTYNVHNISEPWPAEMHGQYDLVHQRLALLGVGRVVTPQKAVTHLAKLVAPGGWIQIGELDVSEPSSSGQAMQDAFKLKRAVFKAVCGFDDYTQGLAGWLVNEGLDEVREESFEVDLGPRCKDPVIAQRSIDVTLQSWEGLLGAAKRFNAIIEESVTDRLIERLEEELTRDGGSYRMLYVYGRRPKLAT